METNLFRIYYYYIYNSNYIKKGNEELGELVQSFPVNGIRSEETN